MPLRPRQSTGGDGVIAYLNHVLNYLGVVSVGGISTATGGRSETVEAAEPAARVLGKKLADAVRDGYPDPVQEALLAENRAYFRTIVEENRDLRTGGVRAVGADGLDPVTRDFLSPTLRREDRDAVLMRGVPGPRKNVRVNLIRNNHRKKRA